MVSRVVALAFGSLMMASTAYGSVCTDSLEAELNSMFHARAFDAGQFSDEFLHDILDTTVWFTFSGKEYAAAVFEDPKVGPWVRFYDVKTDLPVGKKIKLFNGDYRGRQRLTVYVPESGGAPKIAVWDGSPHSKVHVIQIRAELLAR